MHKIKLDDTNWYELDTEHANKKEKLTFIRKKEKV